MGLAEVLTIVFVILKLVGTITWNWWLVLLPEIIVFSFYILIWSLMIREFMKINKQINKTKQRMKDKGMDIDNL